MMVMIPTMMKYVFSGEDVGDISSECGERIKQ